MKKTALICLCAMAATTAWAGVGMSAPHEALSHRMALLVLQLGVMLFAARLGGMFAERLRLPSVTGELLAGVAVGPFALGGIALPGLPDGLFPLLADFPLSPELYGVCSLASVILLFMIGLETDVRLFLRYSATGSLVGVGGVVFSYVAGSALVVALAPVLGDGPVGWLDPFPVFMGIIATATSVGITARVLADRRKVDSPEGSTILSAAIVDDVLGIILLAIGLGVVGSSQDNGLDWRHIGGIALKAAGIWVVATAIGLAASQKIGLLLKWFGDRSAIAVLALGLALILAGLFEGVGLAMIIGAYVAGLSLSGTDINRVIREKMDPVQSLLVPVFFVAMGTLVNVRLLLSGPTILFGLLFVFVVGLAKLAGCGLPARLSGVFNGLGALRIGLGMLPRGEVGLIMAGVALASGALTARQFGIAVFMILTTSVIVSPLLSRAFAGSASGLIKPASAASRQREVSFRFPSEPMADLLTGKLLRAFEAEGFFVHTLHRRRHLYQFRKNKTVIGLARRNADLMFTCAQAEIPFVNTAMYEVVADFEQTLKELRRPLNTAAIGRRMQEKDPGVIAQPALMRYIPPDAVTTRLDGQTKEEVVDELLALLDARGYLTNRKKAREDLWARESSLSTGMQYGIAIPHGRTDGVNRLVCAVGVKREGVDFQSIDGEPTRIIVLTLSPKHLVAPHMQFMAMISQALGEEGRARILAAETPEALWQALAGK